MKKLIFGLALPLFMFSAAFAQDNKDGEVKIQTSAVCTMCKAAIEKDLAFEKGVSKADLDVESGILTVHYKSKKTNPGKIKQAVSKVGYDADDVDADAKAYDKLPACCKKTAGKHKD